MARPTTPTPTWAARTWHGDQLGGLLLAAGALVALVLASSPWRAGYEHLVSARLRLAAVAPGIPSLRGWVNDGLLTPFFLAVGLELAEARASGGPLAGWRRSLPPVLGAAAGMGGAAACYLVVVGGGPLARGWGVPMATDAALVAASAALLGPRVPPWLRSFLLALAVADDLGSVAVLAVVSGQHPSVPWLGLGVVALVAVGLLGRWQQAAWPALGGTVVLWLILARAGVEPALAGALAGATVPAGTAGASRTTAVLEPLVQLLVLPVFGLANLGIDLRSSLLATPAARSVFWAVLVARVVGKPIGVLGGGLVGDALVGRRTGKGPCAGARFRGALGSRGRTGALAGGGALAGAGVTVPLLFAETVFGRSSGLEPAAAAGLVAGTLGASALGALVLLAIGRAQPSALARGPEGAPCAAGRHVAGEGAGGTVRGAAGSPQSAGRRGGSDDGGFSAPAPDRADGAGTEAGQGRRTAGHGHRLRRPERPGGGRRRRGPDPGR
ncbi:Na+/H+ antiporter NhaA [Aciditerrimonas ferrireducens]|uniref:Na+/H+ antiporter NhaA n=1 Tax=Aciditerrimonas ferrireducens TaxID=667306 RepID=UPI00200584DE|nr:Na+/H+ antiporter NhaA [Aciditerrimonas ferrireducens]MCK4176968.1 Na+/H+ antiporter NhaA [Aciditerrimonas ferrireducens]